MLAGELPDELRAPLERVQNELFDVGADLSVPWGVTDRLRVEQPAVDALEERLRPLQRRPARAAQLRAAWRTARPRRGCTSRARLPPRRARRARRGAQELELNPLVLVYLNRLSDLLFILARTANALAGRDEPLWKPGSSR